MSVVTDAASVATSVGVLFGASGLWAQARQRKQALAQLYIKRYWKIADSCERSKDALSRQKHELRYFGLCEDEYEVAALGWIELQVWDVWHAAIVARVRESELPTDDFHLLRECAAHYDEHAARECPALADATWRRKVTWFVESMTTGRAHRRLRA
jgi:hypothetical protein